MTQLNEIIYMFLTVGGGVLVTFHLLLSSIFIGFILGTVFAVMRYRNFCRRSITGFISIIRGTPLILQLGLVYFTFPSLFTIRLSVVSAGIFTFGLNSAAYIAEILRSGIQNIPNGQFEAARVLGIPSYYMWKDIILPQVIRNMLPAMIGEIIALLKETAIIGTIGGMDIMRKAQLVAAEQFTYFIPLCIAGFYYYVIVILIEKIGKFIEKKYNAKY